MSNTLLVMQPPGMPLGPLGSLLARHVPETAILDYAPGWSAEFATLSPEHRGQFRVIKGLLPFGLHGEIGNACDYLLYLSDPVAAALRAYHERWTDGASELAFEDFIREDADGKADNQALALVLGRPAFSAPAAEAEVASAMHHLNTYFLHVGIIEEAEADLPELAVAAGWPRVYLNPGELKLAPVPAVSPAALELVRERNQPALAFYAAARDLARSRRRPATTPPATVMPDIPAARQVERTPSALDAADCAKKPCLIFLHVPKTAGVSITQALRRCVPEEITLAGPEDHSAGRLFDEMPPERQRALRLIYGHMPYGLHGKVEGDWRYLILLRNPLARLMSAYRYYRQNKNSFLHDYITGGHITFKQYVLRGFDRTVDNLQTRYVAGDDDIFEGDRRYIGQLGHDMLDKAVAHIADERALVGVTGELDATMVLLGMEMGYQPYVVETLNASGGSEAAEWDAETLVAACLYNSFDIALYRLAQRRLQERISAVGPAFRERLAAYRERVERMRTGSGQPPGRKWLSVGAMPAAYLTEIGPAQYRFHAFSGSLVGLEGQLFSSETAAMAAIRKELPADFIDGHMREKTAIAAYKSDAGRLANGHGPFRLADPYDDLLERGLALVGDAIPDLT